MNLPSSVRMLSFLKIRKHFTLALLVLIPQQLEAQNTIPHEIETKKKVGSIEFDPEKDYSSFHICDEYNIQEYYQVNPSYGEGLKSIKEYFQPIRSSLLVPWVEFLKLNLKNICENQV